MLKMDDFQLVGEIKPFSEPVVQANARQ